MREVRGWYSRGFLPHLDAGAVPQFLTWRQADSIPAELFDRWRAELADASEPVRKRELYRKTEAFLDSCHGSCVLRNPVAAKIVQEALVFGHPGQYQLHAWSVMPNHVHTLLTPDHEIPLGKIVKSIKSFTATHIHKALGGSGRFWQPDYFDRAMRDERHFEGTLKYIEWNPVKAGLCRDPRHFPYSSALPANFERIRD